MGIGCDPIENNSTGRQWSTSTECQTDIHITLFGGRKVYYLMLCHVTLIIANEKMLL